MWLIWIALAGHAFGQRPVKQDFSRLNTFSGFFEYSNDSSHIILGQAMNRKIGAMGFQYQRRVVHRRPLDFYFQAEIRPAMLESDPTSTVTVMQTSPVSGIFRQDPSPTIQCRTADYSYTSTTTGLLGPTTQSYDVAVTCGRRTVVEQGFSPGGIRINLVPHHRLQPTFSSNAGYIFSSQPVPMTGAGSFNFAFNFGGGVEFFRSQTQSIRLEYQVQHLSNKDTADLNPGIDSGFVRFTYAFGR